MANQQNIAHDDAITNIRFRIRLLTVAVVLTTVTFAGLGWSIFDARRDVKLYADRLSRIKELRGVIVHLDEVLTMSACMAAATVREVLDKPSAPKTDTTQETLGFVEIPGGYAL